MKNIREQIVECVHLTHELQALVEKRENIMLERALNTRSMTTFLLTEAFDLSDEDISNSADSAIDKLDATIDSMVQKLQKGGESFSGVVAQIEAWKNDVPRRGFWTKLRGSGEAVEKKRAEEAKSVTESLTKIQQALAVITDSLQAGVEEVKPVMEWVNSNGDDLKAAIEKLKGGGGGDGEPAPVAEGDDGAGADIDFPEDPLEASLQQIFALGEKAQESEDEDIKKLISSFPKVSSPDKIKAFIETKSATPPGWFQKAQSAAAKETGIMGKGVAFMKGLFGGGDKDFVVDAESLTTAILTTPIKTLAEMVPAIEQASSDQQQASQEIADGSTDILAGGVPGSADGGSGGGNVVTPTDSTVSAGRNAIQSGGDELIKQLLDALKNAGIDIEPDKVQRAASGDDSDAPPSESSETDAIISQVDEEVLDDDGKLDMDALEARIKDLESQFKDLTGQREEDIVDDEGFPNSAELVKLGKDMLGDTPHYVGDMISHEPFTKLFAHKSFMVHRNSMASLMLEGEGDSDEGISWDDLTSSLESIGKDISDYTKPAEDKLKAFFAKAVEDELLSKKISGLDSDEDASSDDEPEWLQKISSTKDEFVKKFQDISNWKVWEKLFGEEDELLKKTKPQGMDGEDLLTPEGYADLYDKLIGNGDIFKDEDFEDLDAILAKIDANLGDWVEKKKEQLEKLLKIRSGDTEPVENPDDLPEAGVDPEDAAPPGGDGSDNPGQDIIDALNGDEGEGAPDDDAPSNPDDFVEEGDIDPENERAVEDAIKDALDNWKEDLSDRQKKRIDNKQRFDQLKDPRVKNATPPETDDVDRDKIGGVYDDWRNDPENETLKNPKNFSQSRLDALKTSLTDTIPDAVEEATGEGDEENEKTGDVDTDKVVGELRKIMKASTGDFDALAEELNASLETDNGKKGKILVKGASDGMVDGEVVSFEVKEDEKGPWLYVTVKQEGDGQEQSVTAPRTDKDKEDDGKAKIITKNFIFEPLKESTAKARWARLAGLPML